MKFFTANFSFIIASTVASFAETNERSDYPHHPPTQVELAQFVFEGFDMDSSFAIDPEEMEAALDALHKNRPGPRHRPESGEARPPRRGPPPPLVLFNEADQNQDKLLQNQELIGLFQTLERAHRASKDSKGDRYGPPTLEGARN